MQHPRIQRRQGHPRNDLHCSRMGGSRVAHPVACRVEGRVLGLACSPTGSLLTKEIPPFCYWAESSFCPFGHPGSLATHVKSAIQRHFLEKDPLKHGESKQRKLGRGQEMVRG